MGAITGHHTNDHIVQTLAEPSFSLLVEEDCRVLITHALHRPNRCEGRAPKHLEETTLLAGVNQLLDRELSLDDLDFELLFDFVFHVED